MNNHEQVAGSARREDYRVMIHCVFIVLLFCAPLCYPTPKLKYMPLVWKESPLAPTSNTNPSTTIRFQWVLSDRSKKRPCHQENTSVDGCEGRGMKPITMESPLRSSRGSCPSPSPWWQHRSAALSVNLVRPSSAEAGIPERRNPQHCPWSVLALRPCRTVSHRCCPCRSARVCTASNQCYRAEDSWETRLTRDPQSS